ncbi:MAG: hypothetical protein JKY37_20410 [Nannocystaceae bacterium]|nr:hypothetical protein [Nannocystaceae bacterium]
MLAVGGIHLLNAGGDTVKCPNASDHLDGIWDAKTRGSLEAHFRGSTAGPLEAAWVQAADTLDEYADTWVIAYSVTCDTFVKGNGDRDVLVARAACLRDRLVDLENAVASLQVSPTLTTAKTESALAELLAIDECEGNNARDVGVPGATNRP